MAKKKKGGGGGANWMDTYGDMVTLLLCFFVLLYSMSTISSDKMKAIMLSFNPNAIQDPTDPGGHDGPFADPFESGAPGINEIENAQEEIDDMMAELLAALQGYAASKGMNDAVSVDEAGGIIYVRLSEKAMFRGDSYDLLPEAKEILGELCGMLDSAKSAIELIQVEGHTAQLYDNQPNATRGDRQLASNRATEVTIFIQDNCTIHPGRICSVGWGQWHGISNNQGEAGKAPNRRVELAISAKDLQNEALGNSLSKYTKEESVVQASAAPAPAASQNP